MSLEEEEMKMFARFWKRLMEEIKTVRETNQPRQLIVNSTLNDVTKDIRIVILPEDFE